MNSKLVKQAQQPVSPAAEFKLSVGPVETCLSHMMRISSHPPSHTVYILTYKLSTLLISVSHSVWRSCKCPSQPLLISKNISLTNISALSQSSFGWHSHLISGDEIKREVFIFHNLSED